MGLRLFGLPKFLNCSLNGILHSFEATTNYVKFSAAGGLKNRIKIVKPDLSFEDDVVNGNLTKSKAKGNKNVEKKKRAALTVVTPLLEEKIIKGLQNVVGLHIGPCSIYWAKIQRSGDVLNWSHKKLFPIAEMSRKIHLPQLYEQVSSMLEHIPVGDVYILEAANQTHPSLQSSSASLSGLLRAQILAMLVVLLNCRVESDLISDSQEHFHRELDCIHKVYFLRPRMMSRLFRLLVGTERVSALDLVDSMLDGSSHLKEDFVDAEQEETKKVQSSKAELPPAPNFTPVKVSSNIAASYYRLRAVEREEMCQALLVAMTFYDLVVFKDPKVLAPLHM